MSDQESVQQTPTIKLNDTVTWNDGEQDLYGTVVSINNNIAKVKDDDNKEYEVAVSDLEIHEGYKVIGELNGYQFSEASFRASKKGGVKEAALKGKAFAFFLPRSVIEAVKFIDDSLKTANKHKEQDNENGHTGEEIFLDNFITAQIAKLRNKVKTAATDAMGTDVQKWLAEHTDRLIFSIEDASKYIPGIREASTGSKLKQLLARNAELKKLGTPEAEAERRDIAQQVAMMMLS